MRRVFRKTVFILIMLLAALSLSTIHAGVWEFGTSGSGQNPFTPRGYLIESKEGIHFISSQFQISSSSVKYSGHWSGVDYVEAEPKGGGSYTFYALTDRNPWPKSENYVGYGKLFLFAFENGREISDFSSYVRTPAAKAGSKDPSGGGSWAFQINGLTLQPGSTYEFGYLCGMQANNGVTLAPAFNENGSRIGFISQPGGEISSEELAQYEEWKNEEYQFVSSWKKTGDGYQVNTVPMRFILKTYADLSRFEAAADQADRFLESVTDNDIREGKYRQDNLEALRQLLKTLRAEARDQVRYMRQPQAEEVSDQMIQELSDMLSRVKSDKPTPSDLSVLRDKLNTAEELLDRAGSNVGNKMGQYGRVEVEQLQTEIGKAKLLHDYSPQDAIDAQARSLQDAIDKVIDSRIREDQRIFYDKVTGIYVIAPVASVPRETSFAVRIMGGNSAAYKAIRKQLNDTETEFVYYSMGLYVGDKKIQPTEYVEVQMPVDSNVTMKNSTVYSVSGKNRLKSVSASKADGTAFFKTKKISDFVIAGGAATEEDKAKARSKRFKELMEQRKAELANQKEIELQKEKKRKKDYKDPVNRMLNHNDDEVSFSEDVKRKTNPVYVLMIAIGLGAAAIAFGIRGIIDYRRRRYE